MENVQYNQRCFSLGFVSCWFRVGQTHWKDAMVANLKRRSSPSAFRRRLGRLRVYAPMICRVDWLLMFTFARFEMVRRHAERSGSGTSFQLSAAAESAVLLVELPAQEIVHRVREDGIADGLRLSEKAVADVKTFAASAQCYGNAQRQRPLKRSPSGGLIVGDATIGDYLDGIAGCKTIQSIWRDPTIRGIAGAYLGIRPLPLRARLWWSFRADHATPTMRSVYSQDCFHFDLDDWRAIKFFFYITDVGPENGPHVYVRKSHRDRSMFDQLSPFKSRSDHHVIKKYGRDNLVVKHGPAGTGFVQDPFGFHTGTSVTGAGRLILEVEYGVSRIPLAGPYYTPPIE